MQAEKRMLEDFFGDMRPLTEEEYIYAFDNMGLELDNRREIAHQMYQEFNDRGIPMMFAALRDTPGAELLSNEDLSTLFKRMYIMIYLNMNIQDHVTLSLLDHEHRLYDLYIKSYPTVH